MAAAKTGVFNFTGVCYVCCEVHAAVSEIRIAWMVLLRAGAEGIVEWKISIFGNVVEYTNILSVERAEDVLRRMARFVICCGAAAVTLVSFGLTRSLLTQFEIYGGTFFSVNCVSTLSKEG